LWQSSSDRRIFHVEHRRSDSWRRKHQANDRLRVLDFATRDHLQGVRNRQANDFENLVIVK